MRFQIEFTDTFCGEANYSWVRRATFEAPTNASDSMLVRRGKKALDLTSRHVRENWGIDVVLRFPGENTIAFITHLPESEG